MAKIVALVGSPNVSGNTASIVNSVLDGAMGLSTNVIKYHNLWKITAFDRGEFILHCHDQKRSPIDESAQEILEDIRTADVLVFGTPVYFDMPTSQFQLILEYMYCMIETDFSSSELAGKKAVIAVSCTEIDRDSLNVVETVAHSLGRFGIQVVDKMIYEDWKGPFKDNPEARKRAMSVGARFNRTIDVDPIEETVFLDRWRRHIGKIPCRHCPPYEVRTRGVPRSSQEARRGAGVHPRHRTRCTGGGVRPRGQDQA